MKLYYTVTQPFFDDNRKRLGHYLLDNGIKFRLGADFASELMNMRDSVADDPLLAVYTLFIEEEGLSAIKLSVEDIKIIKNRFSLELINKFRKCFTWFL